MSVANLTRYEIGGSDCGQSCTSCGMDVSKDGEWVKFEEAVEASSNSLQQLKAEIRAISDIITEYGESGIAVDFPMLKRRLRELSAV